MRVYALLACVGPDGQHSERNVAQQQAQVQGWLQQL